MGLSVVVGLVQAVLLFFARDQIIEVFTTEESVREQMRLAWNIFIVFVIFDTTQGVAQSAIRASQQ